ncbi:hypothetical protein G6L37_00055 [Agrobacterium rubi]|nr:hypothetical protein [Agrobacterium rubi]NTF23642.1 hypothetical protein [Agrobacterium rubi]
MSAIPSLLMILLVSVIGIVSIIGIPFVFLYLLLIFRGQEARLRKALEKCRAVMMSNEKAATATPQLRIHALTHRRRIAVVTDSRFVRLDRGIFGGYEMTDFQWKDLRNATIKENFLPGVFGSDVWFELLDGRHVGINGLKADIASKVYAFSQRQEQSWEEKRRVRSNEDVRAAAGGIYLNSAGGATSSTEGGDVTNELRQAKQMLDEKLISDAEYEEIKSRILSRL